MPQLRKRLTNGASQAGRDQTPEKQSSAVGETTVNLGNRFKKRRQRTVETRRMRIMA